MAILRKAPCQERKLVTNTETRDKLRAYREKHKLSQQRLAELLHVARATINRLERLWHNPHFELAQRIRDLPAKDR